MINGEQFRSFHSRIKIGKPNECWPWMGGKSSSKKEIAYGVVWFDGKKYKAHRLAFELFHRALQKGEFVCHECDNPPCCNPHHLFAGSALDNSLDCISKGRARREHGAGRYNARLDDDQIRQIRSEYIPRVRGIDGLAAKFGVSRSMIYAIITRKRWKHVP